MSQAGKKPRIPDLARTHAALSMLNTVPLNAFGMGGLTATVGSTRHTALRCQLSAPHRLAFLKKGRHTTTWAGSVRRPSGMG
ncbi:hypothetical protein DLM_0026 [Aquitalea magnusonii]|uniref:Uncharacterized protein n=1 Tax=Aquitalea magnusonii TaxID=332411 RepID=A0A3G9G863_9NEIS|nr:hypothetical protein DLM_0026 [Aquitalea magnusonii]